MNPKSTDCEADTLTTSPPINKSRENRKVKVVQNLMLSDIDDVNSAPLGYLYSSVGFPVSKNNIPWEENAD